MSKGCAIGDNSIPEIPMIGESWSSIFRDCAGEPNLFPDFCLRRYLEGNRRSGHRNRSVNDLDHLDGVRGLIVQEERFVVYRQRLILREQIKYLVQMPSRELQIGKSESVGIRLLRPVKDCQDGLTLVFAQQKNTRLLILVCVGQEIQRQSGPAQVSPWRANQDS